MAIPYGVSQQRPFAASDADASAKPVYRPDDPPLPYSRNPRLAALDVMILNYAARRHAQHAASLGAFPPDVAVIIAKDLDAIGAALGIDPGSAPTPPVGPRSQPPEAGDQRTNPLFDATRANVGETGPSRQSGISHGSSVGNDAPDGGVNSQASSFCLLRVANTPE